LFAVFTEEAKELSIMELATDLLCLTKIMVIPMILDLLERRNPVIPGNFCFLVRISASFAHIILAVQTAVTRDSTLSLECTVITWLWVITLALCQLIQAVKEIVRFEIHEAFHPICEFCLLFA
jgi:hypothetical protein